MFYHKFCVVMVVTLIAMRTAVACVIPELSQRDYSVLGVVKNTSGDIIYEEHHNHKADETGGISQVEYKSTSGKIIARKKIDYGCRASAPGYVLTMNQGQQWVEQVSWQSNKLIVTQPESKEVLDAASSRNLVIDAGFDNFVYQNWSELMLGIEKEIDFLHVKGARLFPLVIKLQADNPGIDVSSDVALFKVTAKNKLFRLFSDPIFLGYNKETKHLDFYSGPTNLRGEIAGLEKSNQVTINYLYN